jgi:hypothetical protein
MRMFEAWPRRPSSDAWRRRQMAAVRERLVFRVVPPALPPRRNGPPPAGKSVHAKANGAQSATTRPFLRIVITWKRSAKTT